jgi:hypothetical protein
MLCSAVSVIRLSAVAIPAPIESILTHVCVFTMYYVTDQWDVQAILTHVCVFTMYYVTDQWDVQAIVKRIVAELQRRSFSVWFDCELPHCIALRCCTRVLPLLA